ncbi:MAG TPA: aspartyl protease family protein, partial [Stellaceae bacterium]|nr:aspartyl protease family protein [Stellaceae bacterium]
MIGFVRIAPAILICAAAAAPAFAAENSPKAEALLAATKTEAGGSALDKVTTWHERGKVHASGIDGTYENWADLPGLREAGEFALGPASGSQGWDGKVAWTTDSSKQVRIETSGEAVAQAIQDVYRATFAFLYPNRHKAAIEDAGTKTAEGKTYDAVKITPDGAEPFELWIDPGTHLIAREVQLTGGQPQTFIFSDWRKVDGIETPWKTIQRTADNPKFDVIAETGSIELSKPIPDSRWAPPPPPKDDTEWPAGQTSVTVPIELANNHIYVMASIDGGKPLKFIFDTGATDLFETSKAKALGIKTEGKLPGGGFGDNVSEVGFAKVKSVSLGGLTLHDQVFAAIDLGKLAAVEGEEDLTGLLGYEFAKRANLTIDYADKKMIFTKRDAFQPPAGATAIPFTFDEHTPMVQATIDGVGGEFEVDTGARSALTVMHPFAEANKLIDKYHATHTATVGYGVGGPSRALLARADTLAIGPVSLSKPVTEFVTDTRGAAAAARTAGNIGGDLLRRFTITFDYDKRVLWLQPNALAAEPDVFDRSGLWIMRAQDGTIEIADVAQGSAGAKAGLGTDDVITEVDGKPAAGLALNDLRERFKAAAGTK